MMPAGLWGLKARNPLDCRENLCYNVSVNHNLTFNGEDCMELEQIGSNFTRLQIGHKQVWFSYKTPIAFHDGTRLFARQNDWAQTTGKHLNAVDGGDPLAKRDRYPGDEFTRMLKTEFNL
jgi:hypothetical protein